MEQLANLSVYSERVLHLFDAPPHAGRPEGANRTGAANSKTRGASVRLHLREVDGRIDAAGFEARGCPHLIAAAALVAEDLRGRPLDELAGYTAAFVDDALPLPAGKRDLRILLEDAVRDAVRHEE